MLDKLESLNMNIDDADNKNKNKNNKDIEIITILLVGSTGSGKSTLANVISDSGDYDTSHRSVSSTKDTNSHNYAINGKIYKIVDTVGIGDTRISPKEVASKLVIA